jgi:sugar phosphate isomerase/epimerase
MRLGIGSYAFAWSIGVPGHEPKRRMSAFDLLEEARRLGVRVVQFCDNLPLVSLGPADLGEFERAFRQLGLTIELGTRGLEPGNLLDNLRLAQRFGCSFLRLVVDSKGDEPSPEQVVTRLRPHLTEFERAGVCLAIENHDRFTCETLLRIVDQLGKDRVGICLDTVNSFGALQGPDVVVGLLGPRTLCLHVKDITVRRMSHQMGFVDEGSAAGKGKLDIPWLLEKIRPCAPRCNAILETWVTPSDSLDETIHRERAWAEEGVRDLRTLIPD